MSLLANAKISIELGLADYNSGDDNRLISAVRNFHAGVLLLLKEKLRRLSPPDTNEVLIKAKVVPQRDASGNIIFVGQGRKTVDIHQIKDLFKSLGIRFEWARYEEVARVRHDVEHHYTSAGRDAIRGFISKNFVLVRDFVTNELREEPLLVLGPVTWKVLLDTQEVFEKERAECVQQLERVHWHSEALREAVLDYWCMSCASSLLVPEDTTKSYSETILKCRSCRETNTFIDYAEEALIEHFAAANHLNVRDGGEPATINCPFCGKEGYVVAEERCALCGERAQRTCSICDNSIPTSEWSDGSVCGYCQHKIEKAKGE